MVTCNYCTRPAKLLSTESVDEPLCTPCAIDQYSDYRESTVPLNAKNLALYAPNVVAD